jgi:flavin reductase (DIM6/NTAB) family NADH-FMN oxidoreductase RutF
LLEPSDQRFLRDVLGCFATGVTIITACRADGQPIGLTVNSFNAVSLDPPLVLWSQNCQSSNAPVFAHTAYFAVNILAGDQEPLARQFASKVPDRFAGVDYQLSAEGVPLIAGCAAWLICRTSHHYPEGDHVIHLGQIVRCQHTAQPALLFHRGQFAQHTG